MQTSCNLMKPRLLIHVFRPVLEVSVTALKNSLCYVVTGCQEVLQELKRFDILQTNHFRLWRIWLWVTLRMHLKPFQRRQFRA